MPALCAHPAKLFPPPVGRRSPASLPAVPRPYAELPPPATARATSPLSDSFLALSRSCLRRPPLVQSFLDLLLNSLLRRLVVSLLLAKVILRDEMLRMIMRVLVSLPVAEAFGPFV